MQSMRFQSPHSSLLKALEPAGVCCESSLILNQSEDTMNRDKMDANNEVECAMCKIGLASLNNIPMELRKFVREAAYEWSFLSSNRGPAEASKLTEKIREEYRVRRLKPISFWKRDYIELQNFRIKIP
ncbi:unnamed protein product [Colias eurytheme]|nr:unnamed protein product [Colias eurytheme]